MIDNPLMLPGESNAGYCRRMGHSVGTRLVGDEGYGPTVIELTAIGERSILAKDLSWRGEMRAYASESMWSLDCRAWTEVAGAPAYYGA